VRAGRERVLEDLLAGRSGGGCQWGIIDREGEPGVKYH